MRLGRLLRAGSLIALAVCCVALAGCGAGPGHSSITLYNGQHTQLTSSLVAAFEKATGITVQIRTDDSAVLADQIVQEGDASPADVYISENSPELMNLQRRGLLTQLPQSILGQVPKSYQSPMGNWVGMALRVSSLVYNPAHVPRSQLPASLLDMAQPQWKGKIAIAPADSDFPPIVAAVIAEHGEAAARTWLAGLKRNARIYQDEESIVAAVNRGDVATGVINQYYWYRLRLEIGTKAIHSAALLLLTRRCRGGHQHLRGGDPRVEQAPEECRTVRQLPRQRGRPADHREERRLRVPRPCGRRTQHGASTARKHQPHDGQRRRTRQRRARRPADPPGRAGLAARAGHSPVSTQRGVAAPCPRSDAMSTVSDGSGRLSGIVLPNFTSAI